MGRSVRSIAVAMILFVSASGAHAQETKSHAAEGAEATPPQSRYFVVPPRQAPQPDGKVELRVRD